MKNYIQKLSLIAITFLVIALFYSCNKDGEEVNKTTTSAMKGNTKSTSALEFNIVVADLLNDGAIELPFDPIANNPMNEKIVKGSFIGKYLMGKNKEYYVVLGFKEGESGEYQSMNVYDEKGQVMNAKVIICEVTFSQNRLNFNDVCKSLSENGAEKYALDEWEFDKDVSLEGYSELQLFNVGKEDEEKLILVAGYKSGTKEAYASQLHCNRMYTETKDDEKQVTYYECYEDGNQCYVLWVSIYNIKKNKWVTDTIIVVCDI